MRVKIPYAETKRRGSGHEKTSGLKKQKSLSGPTHDDIRGQKVNQTRDQQGNVACFVTPTRHRPGYVD